MEVLEVKSEIINRAAIDSAVQETIAEVMSGNQNPLELYIRLKAIEQAAKQATAAIRSGAMDEADKYESGARVLGCEFEVRNLPDKWDFSNDPIYHDAAARMDMAKEEMKARAAVLKAAYRNGKTVDENTGEVMAVSMESGGRTIAVKIAK